MKNVYLWQERSWFRKGLEAGMTPMVEALWSKRRILEVYLNVAEFGEGVFGVEAAARHYFGVSADALSARQVDPGRRGDDCRRRAGRLFRRMSGASARRGRDAWRRLNPGGLDLY